MTGKNKTNSKTENKKNSLYKLYINALEIEREGQEFYRQASASAANQVGRKIFAMLADDELVHLGRLKAICGQLLKTHSCVIDLASYKISYPDIGRLFKKLAQANRDKVNPQASDLDALDVGIDLEDRTLAFYSGRLKSARDEPEKKFLSLMVREETEHHNLLADMKFYLTNPLSWFVEHEKHGLDGV